MKIDIPKTLVEEALTQLAALRGTVSDPEEWDQSPLGKLRSILAQESHRFAKSRRGARSSSVANRRKASSRFRG
jgi:hypothetical protein